MTRRPPPAFARGRLWLRALIGTIAAAAFFAAGFTLAAARSGAVGRAFQHAHPCPATGRSTGACPGWVKDHIIPLACGGPDEPSNLQWQTDADAKAKDRWERRGCKR